ncbi:MAG: porin, partial [Nevskia sp.]|nr:porin [Nevskia sp.]
NEFTVTLDYSPAANFDLLGEVRADGSSNHIYPNGDPADLKGTESDIAIKAIYKFGTPTGS